MIEDATAKHVPMEPTDPPTPFRVEVPPQKLDTIRARVRGYRWDHFGEPADGGDWRYGPPSAYLRELCAYWAEGYDWRAQEGTMNAVPHFLANVDGLDLHFVHERGSGPAPRPLLILHGWPYSFHSYTHLVERLAHPERHGGRVEDAFSVVVPSFPGYDFSGRPAAPMGPRQVATVLHRLMVETLGYGRYLAHGGDWGGYLVSLLGFDYPGQVAGIHSTALIARQSGAPSHSGQVAPDASEEEKAFAARELALWKREGGYALLQKTKPQALAYATADSPVGVAAWIVEKFHAWSDRRERPFGALFTRDQLLTEVMLYLVTDAFATSLWLYAGQERERLDVPPPGRRIEVPVGVAAFPDPVFPPVPRAVAEKSHRVVRYTVMPRGGHFPFYEAPDLLVDDLRQFARGLPRG